MPPTDCWVKYSTETWVVRTVQREVWRVRNNNNSAAAYTHTQSYVYAHTVIRIRTHLSQQPAWFLWPWLAEGNVIDLEKNMKTGAINAPLFGCRCKLVQTNLCQISNFYWLLIPRDVLRSSSQMARGGNRVLIFFAKLRFGLAQKRRHADMRNIAIENNLQQVQTIPVTRVSDVLKGGRLYLIL